MFEGTRWNEEKKKLGKKARRVCIKFDKILDYNVDEILCQSTLKNVFPDFHWSPQSSGIEIPESIAEKLECLWE